MDLFLCKPFLSFCADDNALTSCVRVAPHLCPHSIRHKVLLIGKNMVQISGHIRSRCAWLMKAPVRVNRCEVSETERPSSLEKQLSL